MISGHYSVLTEVPMDVGSVIREEDIERLPDLVHQALDVLHRGMTKESGVSEREELGVKCAQAVLRFASELALCVVDENVPEGSA